MASLVALVLVSLASMVSWEIIRYLTPFNINVRIAPLIVVAICYGWSYYDHRPSFLLAFAAATGVLILHRITGAEGIEPWKRKRHRINIARKRSADMTLPELPPSVGRRIPDL